MPAKSHPPTGDLEAHRLRLDDFDTFARIYVARDGGPVRTIITGREPHATGRYISVKANHRAQPWESFWGELPMLQLCEAASPVISLLAQPHRLEMVVEGHRDPLIVFPDFQMTVDRRFAEDVCSGTAFTTACANWLPDLKAGDDPVELVVEVKTKRDPRLHDPVYQAKLTLAEEVYARLGWFFVQVVHDPDERDYRRIAPAVREINLDHDVVVTPHDIQVASDHLGGKPTRLRDLARAIGGGTVAIQKISALHVRRSLAVDLRGRLSPKSMVFPMRASSGVA